MGNYIKVSDDRYWADDYRNTLVPVDFDIFTDIEFDKGPYEGIPLTPDILERCNMKRRFDTVDCNIWDSIEKPPTRNKAFSLALIKEGWVYMSAPGVQAFKNIHQLQNLYFALTGEELNIQL